MYKPLRRSFDIIVSANFEAATRPYLCTSCHNPANPANINPLVFFTHPRQALVARRNILKRLSTNTMPLGVRIPTKTHERI